MALLCATLSSLDTHSSTLPSSLAKLYFPSRPAGYRRPRTAPQEEKPMSFSLAFTHAGIYVTDMDRMVDFYTRVVGFAIADRGPRLQGGGEIAFMTRDPREHHQLVLATGRPANLSFNMVNQLSFLVDSLTTLRVVYRDLKSEPAVEELGPVTHGNALSAYFL